MNDKLKNLSDKQKELLIKRLQGKIEVNFSKTLHEEPVNFSLPFGYLVPKANFSKIQAKNFTLSPPNKNQIQIRAKAISLNFRDLMMGLGLYPEIPGVPSYMGGDYSGVVIAVGENVTKFKVGDEVIALYEGGMASDLHFASQINVYTGQTAFKPKKLSFEEASCIPMVFLTAYHGLIDLARLAKGETVLIHTASGGVGLAAIQIAKWRQANILATAGSDQKRAYLASLGIKKIMSSRSLEFYDQSLEFTQKQGVDVILNTLSGEAIEKGMLLLKNFGRFVQLDKNDMSQKRSINLDLFKKSCTFIFLDLALLFNDEQRLKTVFYEVSELFENNIFSSIPYTTFSHFDLEKALNFMPNPSRIGKIVLNF